MGGSVSTRSGYSDRGGHGRDSFDSVTMTGMQKKLGRVVSSFLCALGRLSTAFIDCLRASPYVQ